MFFLLSSRNFDVVFAELTCQMIQFLINGTVNLSFTSHFLSPQFTVNPDVPKSIHSGIGDHLFPFLLKMMFSCIKVLSFL